MKRKLKLQNKPPYLLKAEKYVSVAGVVVVVVVFLFFACFFFYFKR